MSLIEVRNSIYRVGMDDVNVSWASYDFRKDVAGIPDAEVRTTLLETGVMYIPAATPKIRVSYLLPVGVQGLSALHEELCMNQKIALCPNVEEAVIDLVQDPQLRTDFINTRIRMFGALCMMDESNEQFKATQLLLMQKSM